MITVSDKTKCSGCSACSSLCPKKCIRMITDKEGFKYPVVDRKRCIACGLCEKVCPVKNIPEKNYEAQDEAYILRTKSYSIWRKSASGGAFTEICNAFADDNTMIFGASFVDLIVKHVAITGMKDIDKLRKSKYIASEIDGIFPKVRKFLQAGKKVVFSGTPCQVAGLKNYLRKDYSNLLTIDLVCHGVGSPAVFKTCVDIEGKECGEEISKYTFRAKRFFYETDYLTKMQSKSGKVLWRIKDRYNQLFLAQKCNRPSCGNHCAFRQRTRVSDFTIADFKGLYIDYPQLRADRKNCSTVICHTSKSRMILERVKKKAIVINCPMDYVQKYNPLYSGNTWDALERDDFFKAYIENPNETIIQWTTPSVPAKISLKMVLSKCVSIKLKNFISQRTKL